MEEQEKKKREEEEKAAKREQKKAELKAKAEELKNDPLYKARAFGKSLLGDILQVKALVARLHGCGELAETYVRALAKDEEEMDKMYSELQTAITARDVVKVKSLTESIREFVEVHSKRFRLARGQVLELEKMEKEKDSASKGSSGTGKKK